jgi:hypothetical protein
VHGRRRASAGQACEQHCGQCRACRDTHAFPPKTLYGRLVRKRPHWFPVRRTSATDCGPDHAARYRLPRLQPRFRRGRSPPR